MVETTANNFRENLKSEVDRVIENHDVLRVTRRKGGDFVVLSADDWDAIAETIYLNQIPGMVESVQAAAKEPIDEGTQLKDLDW